eukprot:SAG31_NODE_3614_length_4066_cov_16.818755_4_plen_382_part_01
MRANTSLILWCWHILLCVLSGNVSHLIPVFDHSIGNSVPGLTFIDLPGSTCATLTSPEACYLPINLDGGNATSSDLQIRYGTDMGCSKTTRGMQVNFFPRITSSGVPGGTTCSLTRHADAKAFIPEDSMETGNGTSSDLQISSATDMSCSGTTKGMQIDFTAGYTSSNLAGGTGATLTRHVDAKAFIREDRKDGGNATSSDLQIRSGTSDTCTISCFIDLFDFSTTTKTCTGFAPRHPFSNGGTIATLTPHATVKDFNLNTYLDSGNRTSDNCTIVTNPFDFSTTTKTCTGFAPPQASTNLPSGAGSTLTSHATAINKAFSLDAGNGTSDNCSVSCFAGPFDFPITTKTCTCFVTSNLHNVSKRHSGAPSSRHLTLSSRTHI